jgi:tetratricopeptide (TPR) repeat protein
MMGRLTAYLIRSFRTWERSSQVAMMIALVLLIIVLTALFFAPLNFRQPTLIGVIGLVIIIQIIFMWANRGMVTPFTQAQRFYLAEAFDSARVVLESALDAGKPDSQLLTLLGNTYRQLGMLDESQEVLTKAIELRPFDHFSLYGFGRTLLVRGLYAPAAEAISQALQAGAPPIVQFDLGEARYRQGVADEARLSLELARRLDQEAHRALMTDYLLYKIGVGEVPPRELIQSGLPYWQDNAERYRHTPYGKMLMHDVQQMLTFVEES